MSDIFGLTDELIELGHALEGDNLIIDPYKGERNLFTDENLAYQYFTNNIGLENYSLHVYESLSEISEQVSIIAFSVGASSVWKYSGKINPESINTAYLFYGSQIRNMLDIQPNFKLNIVLPNFEESFSVSAMADTLGDIENVSLEHSEFLHGFMNKRSRNFCPAEYNNYTAKLIG